MRKTIRIVSAGVIAGTVASIVLYLTFGLIGFGIDGDGILTDPDRQSEKLISVWTEQLPLPLVISNPLAIVIGFILLSVGHAFFYQWMRPVLPAGKTGRIMLFGFLIFFFSYVFFEFFTPFNMFGEPLSLILVELLFWGLTALSESAVIINVVDIKDIRFYSKKGV
jgi:hypothetical protein